MLCVTVVVLLCMLCGIVVVCGRPVLKRDAVRTRLASASGRSQPQLVIQSDDTDLDVSTTQQPGLRYSHDLLSMTGQV